MTSGIITNPTSVGIHSASSQANSLVQKTGNQLASGKRISKSSDDVAGLAIGTNLSSNLTTLKAAKTNTQQAIALLDIADSALAVISDALSRQKALATQAAAGSLTDDQRAFLNEEFVKLTDEIDRIAGNSNFNGILLLDGSATGVNFQVGTDSTDKISISINDSQTAAIHGQTPLAIDTIDHAVNAVTKLTDAINMVITNRSTVGALHSRFETAQKNIDSGTISLDAARSVYMDTDIAEVSTENAQNSVRYQAAVSMLAQANQLPQSLLKLLG